jgi:hypothetical protein
MADIFISWSSPDAEIVLPVIRRLERHGLDLEQFEADSDAGSIEQSVQGYIEKARLMVMFVSEKTNERDWLKQEAAWAAYRQAEQKRKNWPVLKMIPVLMGNVELTKLNAFLAKNEDQKRLTVPPPAQQVVNAAATGDVQPAERLAAGAISEAALQNIVLRICDTLDLPKPIVIPIILLAMTRAEAKRHLNDPREYAKIADLCTAAGMEPLPKALCRLLPRYKENADKFSPFPGEPPLKEIVETALKPINDARPKDQPLLWPWWCRDALFGPLGSDYDHAVEKIGQGPSFLILDSISAEFDTVRNQYRDVVGLDARGRQVLLWVPPFTIHTATFRKYIEKLLERPPRLRQEFLRWGRFSGSGPHSFLDIATTPSLLSWLYDALRAIASEPVVAAVASESVREDKRGPSGLPL